MTTTLFAPTMSGSQKARQRPGDDLSTAIFETSWGWMGALVSPQGLRRLTLPRATQHEAMANLAEITSASINRGLSSDFGARLDRYFRGEQLAWDYPLDAIGTPFQKAVWQETSAIGRGQTATYRELAFAVGIPAGARAIGGAMRANPIPIVVPCHRVVGSNGGLGGYAGPTGIELKARLLRLEGASW